MKRTRIDFDRWVALAVFMCLALAACWFSSPSIWKMASEADYSSSTPEIFRALKPLEDWIHSWGVLKLMPWLTFGVILASVWALYCWYSYCSVFGLPRRTTLIRFARMTQEWEGKPGWLLLVAFLLTAGFVWPYFRYGGVNPLGPLAAAGSVVFFLFATVPPPILLLSASGDGELLKSLNELRYQSLAAPFGIAHFLRVRTEQEGDKTGSFRVRLGLDWHGRIFDAADDLEIIVIDVRTWTAPVASEWQYIFEQKRMAWKTLVVSSTNQADQFVLPLAVSPENRSLLAICTVEECDRVLRAMLGSRARRPSPARPISTVLDELRDDGPTTAERIAYKPPNPQPGDPIPSGGVEPGQVWTIKPQLPDDSRRAATRSLDLPIAIGAFVGFAPVAYISLRSLSDSSLWNLGGSLACGVIGACLGAGIYAKLIEQPPTAKELRNGALGVGWLAITIVTFLWVRPHVVPWTDAWTESWHWLAAAAASWTAIGAAVLAVQAAGGAALGVIYALVRALFSPTGVDSDSPEDGALQNSEDAGSSQVSARMTLGILVCYVLWLAPIASSLLSGRTAQWHWSAQIAAAGGVHLAGLFVTVLVCGVSIGAVEQTLAGFADRLGAFSLRPVSEEAVKAGRELLMLAAVVAALRAVGPRTLHWAESATIAWPVFLSVPAQWICSIGSILFFVCLMSCLIAVVEAIASLVAFALSKEPPRVQVATPAELRRDSQAVADTAGASGKPGGYRFGEILREVADMSLAISCDAIPDDIEECLQSSIRESISLDRDEKWRLLHALPKLEARQLQALSETVRSERAKWMSMPEDHAEELRAREAAARREWEELCIIQARCRDQRRGDAQGIWTLSAEELEGTLSICGAEFLSAELALPASSSAVSLYGFTNSFVMRLFVSSQGPGFPRQLEGIFVDDDTVRGVARSNDGVLEFELTRSG